MPAMAAAMISGSVLSAERIELVLIEVAMRPTASRSRRDFVDDDVGDQLVAAAFLMLLAARVQVARVDDRQRRGAVFVLAEAFGEQLVVPQAGGFQALAPGRQHADRRAAQLLPSGGRRRRSPARCSRSAAPCENARSSRRRLRAA